LEFRGHRGAIDLNHVVVVSSRTLRHNVYTRDGLAYCKVGVKRLGFGERQIQRPVSRCVCRGIPNRLGVDLVDNRPSGRDAGNGRRLNRTRQRSPDQRGLDNRIIGEC